MKVNLQTRLAEARDAVVIARIYNEGIVDRIATFETASRDEAAVLKWFDQRHPIVVVENDGEVIAFAASSSSSGRCCYAGNADFSVYVARAERGHGAGAAAMRGLIDEARARGFTKLLSGVFPENTASLSLLTKLGFREVGRHEKHGKLDGVWKDVVLVELVL
jgi:phosphinothricin acetyltransferase